MKNPICCCCVLLYSDIVKNIVAVLGLHLLGHVPVIAVPRSSVLGHDTELIMSSAQIRGRVQCFADFPKTATIWREIFGVQDKTKL